MENPSSNPYATSQYFPGHGQGTANKSHSPFGIASLALSLFAGIFLFVALVIAGYLETKANGGLDENSTAAGVLGLTVVGLVGLELIAGVFGLAGLFQTDRKRILAVVGILLSAMTILGIVGLIIIGSMM